MKVFLSLCWFILLCLTGMTACGKNDDPNNPPSTGADMTTNCKSPSESGVYSSFFKPLAGWVGDPMPFFDNGKFYVFYLQDWRDGSPNFHPWHMASTTDFATFAYAGEAIPCGSIEAQDIAIGTGSVIKANNKYYAFYTGHKWNRTTQPREGVMLATSTDLKTWTKNPSFILYAAGGYDRDEFRDPFVFYDNTNKEYKMLVSTRYENKAVLAQYGSQNLVDWTLQNPFYSDAGVFMIECIDLFVQGDYQYLFYSDINDRKVHYKYRKLTEQGWSTPDHSMVDGIAFYAAKTASNGADRFLCGWCPSKNGETDEGNFDWGGSLVTHRLRQNTDGTFNVAIPQKLDDKFSKQIQIDRIGQQGNVSQQNGIYSIGDASQLLFGRLPVTAKLSMNLKASAQTTRMGIGFGACGDRGTVYAVRFDLANGKLKLDKDVTVNGTVTTSTMNEVGLPVPADRSFDIKVVMEKSVCVVYVNNSRVFTNRIYKMNQNPWTVFAEGGQVSLSGLAAMGL